VNDAEVAILCRFVAAVSPAQQWDEFTVDAWAMVLPADFTLEECRAAVMVIKRRRQWVDPSDIVAEVRLARRPAAEARHLHELIGGPDAYRAHIEDANAVADAALARISDRTGIDARQILKAVPPPDYDDDSSDEGES
jgi:hypothetical protein